jgi:hypothetical protein
VTATALTQVYRPLSDSVSSPSLGLLSALFGDGLWDAISWLLLALPLSVLIFSVYR